MHQKNHVLWLLDAEHSILQDLRLKDGAAEKALEAKALALALGNSLKLRDHQIRILRFFWISGWKKAGRNPENAELHLKLE